ncbi:hypothetical protein ACTT2I_10440 [Stenotrophomonas sp. PUT21]|uniref:hypothetical protein n=1 Tax=Stenotrophomonas sp. PUT21 TaxID=3456954 RepID=UPI003FCD6B9F
MSSIEQQQKDQQFRERMAASNAPEAKLWTALDQQAERQKQGVEKLQRSLDKRLDPSPVIQLEEQLQELNEQRHEMEVLGRPSAFMFKQRAEYDRKMGALEAGVKETRREIRDWARRSEPGEVMKHQQRMELMQEELHETVRERQRLGMMPSEQEQKKQEREGEVETPSSRIQAWRKERQKDKEVRVDYPSFGAGKWGGATFAATALGEQQRFKQDEANFDWQKQDRERQNIWRQ